MIRDWMATPKARVRDNILLAIVYFLTAQVGHMLSIPPGNISPVWIPSGIVLAAMLFRGYHLWPGILIGALISNAWTSINLGSLAGFIVSLLPGLANGTGAVLGALLSAWSIRQFTDRETVFKDIRHLSVFLLFGALLGPLISALFGVTSLRIIGDVEAQHYFNALITWWTGDGVGVLVLTPFFLIWYTERHRPLNVQWIDFVILIVLLMSSFYLLGYVPLTHAIRLPTFTLAPILIWSVFSQDIRLTYTGILIVSTIAVVAAVLNLGPFTDESLNTSLINLQLFLAVLTMTVMYLQATVFEMQRLNAERGLLLKEIHHRVKNNLQVISGLLILQSRSSSDDKVKLMLRESQHRINSMALIHEMLYQSEQFLAINMDDYLRNLNQSLADSILGADHDVYIDVDARGIRLSVETGIPLGLLITEIVTNSLKHGLQHNGHDRIYIYLRRLPGRKLQLRIGDNGRGMDRLNNPVQYKTLGLKLIRSLSEQLGGEIRRDADSTGTRYTLEFQAEDK